MRTLILIMALTLTACGGGGTSDPPPPPEPEPLGIEAHCVALAIEGLTPDGMVTCALGNYRADEMPDFTLALTNLDDTDFEGSFVMAHFINGHGTGVMTGPVSIPAGSSISYNPGTGNSPQIVNGASWVEMYIYNTTDQRSWAEAIGSNPNIYLFNWSIVSAAYGNPWARTRSTYKIIP